MARLFPTQGGKSAPLAVTRCGAAGVTEIVISILAMKHGILPGSANTRDVDPAMRCSYLVEPRRAPVRRVLSNSFGFGGSNCSVVLEARA